MWAWLAACADPVTLEPDGRPADPDDTVPAVLASEPCDACGGDCVLETLSYPARYHATGGVDYADVPPAGGPHDPCWTDFGVHAEPVADEHWVHNLEHGAVVFAYACEDGCPEDRAALESTAVLSPWGLAMPYPALAPDGGDRFAALAWEVRLLTGCFDPALAAAFAAEHEDRAPESVLGGPGEGCM